MRNRALHLICILVVVATFIGATAFAALPGTISFAGSLRTAAGTAAPDGDYTLDIKLWSAAKGGASLWSEGLTIVTVKGGAFEHALGAKKPLGAALLPADGKVWLGVTVGKDPELPRVPLRATAFALRAGQAEGLLCSG